MKKLVLLMVVLLIAGSCAKEEKRVLPYVRVYFSIATNDPQYQSLQNPAVALKVRTYLAQNIGYLGNGVIIFHEIDNTFYAYDATCPNSDYKSLNIDGIFAVCPSCGTRYSLLTGYASGGSSLHLQRYNVMASGYLLTVNS